MQECAAHRVNIGVLVLSGERKHVMHRVLKPWRGRLAPADKAAQPAPPIDERVCCGAIRLAAGAEQDAEAIRGFAQR